MVALHIETTTTSYDITAVTYHSMIPHILNRNNYKIFHVTMAIYQLLLSYRHEIFEVIYISVVEATIVKTYSMLKIPRRLNLIHKYLRYYI